jgi:hypothetical protein
MYMSDTDEAEAVGPQFSIPLGAGIALAVCLVVTLVVGVWPGSISGLAQDAVPALVAAGG